MISIVGATGFTGSLIARQLSEEQLPMRLLGRSRLKLEQLATTCPGNPRPEVGLIDLASLESISSALSGSKVVISCAGPFTELGMNVAEAAISKGIHYLDITGEQAFIASVIERFSRTALSSGSIAIPSCAFEYALADAAAAIIEDQLSGLESFESTYVLDGLYTSRGTKHSVLCALESPAYQLADGRHLLVKPGSVSRFQSSEGPDCRRFPFPAGEVFLIPLHSGVKNISTYLASSAPSAVLSFLSTSMPVISRTPLKGLLDSLIRSTPAVPARHMETRFSLFCRGRAGAQTMELEISGLDPYTLTARIAAKCARFLLAESLERQGGVLSASMLDGGDFIRRLTEESGVTWKEKSN